MAKVELAHQLGLTNLVRQQVLELAGFRYKRPLIEIGNYDQAFASLYSYAKGLSDGPEVNKMVLARSRRNADLTELARREFFVRLIVYQEEPEYVLSADVTNYVESSFIWF